MPFLSLWIPVVVATVAVVVVSLVACIAGPHHKGDFKKLPDEDGFIATLDTQGVPAGQFMFPHYSSPSDFKDPAVQAKWDKGPVGIIVVSRKGLSMGKALGLWAVNVFAITFLTAYVARHTLVHASPHVEVFRVTGMVAAGAYAMGIWQESIWRWRPWRVTAMAVLDGVVYALVTAAIFCWLWPAAPPA